MTLVIPDEHREENLKLSADGYVDLYHIHLTDGSNFYVKNGDPVSWLGQDWEPLPISLTGYEIKRNMLMILLNLLVR